MIPPTIQALPQGTSSKYFTGREIILEQLSEHFAPRPVGGPRRTFLLLGLAGVGKSQIAMKFAEINKARYESQEAIHSDPQADAI
jgi:Cdc6-like AAA superfamily ATPase